MSRESLLAWTFSTACEVFIAEIDLLNDDRRTAADAIVERALDRAVVRGHTLLYQ